MPSATSLCSLEVVFHFLLYPWWYLCTLSRSICCPCTKGAGMTWWQALCYSQYRGYHLEQMGDVHSALWKCKYRHMLSTSTAGKDNLLWSANFPADIGKVTWPPSMTAEQCFSTKLPSSPSFEVRCRNCSDSKAPWDKQRRVESSELIYESSPCTCTF